MLQIVLQSFTELIVKDGAREEQVWLKVRKEVGLKERLGEVELFARSNESQALVN